MKPDLSTFDGPGHVIARGPTPTSHAMSQCRTCGISGHKNASGKCGVCGSVEYPRTGSLHDEEAQTESANPTAHQHSDVGSLHDAETKRKLSMPVNPAEPIHAAPVQMQSAFIPGEPKKLDRPVVTQTTGLPPHEKLVPGSTPASDGGTRDVNQPPIVGPIPQTPVYQRAFPLPHEQPVPTRMGQGADQKNVPGAGSKLPDEHVLDKSQEKPQKESSTAEKNDWISAKIKKIMSEGIRGRKVSQKQAVAAAESMYRQEHGK